VAGLGRSAGRPPASRRIAGRWRRLAEGRRNSERISAGCAESRPIATDDSTRDNDLRHDPEDAVSSRGPPQAGGAPATSQTSSGDPAMNPDPLDLGSSARAPGDPSATSPPPDAGPTAD